MGTGQVRAIFLPLARVTKIISKFLKFRGNCFCDPTIIVFVDLPPHKLCLWLLACCVPCQPQKAANSHCIHIFCSAPTVHLFVPSQSDLHSPVYLSGSFPFPCCDLSRAIALGAAPGFHAGVFSSPFSAVGRTGVPVCAPSAGITMALVSPRSRQLLSTLCPSEDGDKLFFYSPS